MAKMRVSVGNLAPRLVVAETGEVQFFGILNRKAYEKGRRLVGAVGGAAELTEAGRVLLESRFDATEFEGVDARFVIEEEHLEKIFEIFEGRNSSIYETEAGREIGEELAIKELPIQNSPILSAEEVAQVEIYYVKTVRQKTSGGTSARESAEIPTRRIFNLFEIVVPTAVFEKMKSSPAIYFLSTEEIASTDGGSRKGQAADGTELADNLIW